MELKLTVRQRIDLQGVLPRQGNFTAIKMIRETRESLSFSEEEHKQIELQYHANGNVGWDAKKAKSLVKTIKIPATICSMLKASLKELDKQEKLVEEHIELYEMFVNAYNNTTA